MNSKYEGEISHHRSGLFILLVSVHSIKMTKNIIIPLVLMCLMSFPGWGVTYDDLVKREGLYYKKFSDIPFTGEMVRYHDNGQLWRKGNYKNGKEEGTWVYYWDNGQLRMKGNYTNGKEEGTWEYYHKNGQLKGNGDYRNGEKEGTWVWYWSNGQLDHKGDYKNGKKEGYWEFYDSNGNSDEYAGTYRNDKKFSD